jgi:hypothetical protein
MIICCNIPPRPLAEKPGQREKNRNNLFFEILEQ